MVTERDLVLLANTVKNYRSANPLVQKQGLLVMRPHGREWALSRSGRESKGSGKSRVTEAKGQGGKYEGGQRPSGLRPGGH